LCCLTKILHRVYRFQYNNILTKSTNYLGINMLKFIDLFCGGGFGARGAIRGGGSPVMALDAWEVATQTYKANFPGANVIHGRIEDVDPRKYRHKVSPDILLTSPECTAHSIARGAKPGSEKSRETAMWFIPLDRRIQTKVGYRRKRQPYEKMEEARRITCRPLKRMVIRSVNFC
jgi:hypothetical protein